MTIFRVDGKQLFHREAVRSGKFQNYKMTARFQYAAHLGEPFVEIFEIADTESYSNSVKSLSAKESEVQSSRAKDILSDSPSFFTFSRPTFIIPSEIVRAD